MQTYLVFSDEGGDYQRHPPSQFVDRHPYYIRGSVMVPAEGWHMVEARFQKWFDQLDLDPGQELKWADIASLLYLRQENRPRSNGSSYGHLMGIQSQQLRECRRDVLGLLEEMENSAVIYTVTENPQPVRKRHFYRMHIQNHMQRVQMEADSEDLAIFFLDAKGDPADKLTKQAYRALYDNGVFLEYENIKDSPSFEVSHESAGIMLADFVTGCFNGYLKGYEESTDRFFQDIWPRVRKDRSGDPMGWGVIDVPSREYLRDELRTELLRTARERSPVAP